MSIRFASDATDRSREPAVVVSVLFCSSGAATLYGARDGAPPRGGKAPTAPARAPGPAGAPKPPAPKTPGPPGPAASAPPRIVVQSEPLLYWFHVAVT